MLVFNASKYIYEQFCDKGHCIIHRRDTRYWAIRLYTHGLLRDPNYPYRPCGKKVESLFRDCWIQRGMDLKTRRLAVIKSVTYFIPAPSSGKAPISVFRIELEKEGGSSNAGGLTTSAK